MKAAALHKYLKIRPSLFGLEVVSYGNYLKTKGKASVSSLHCDICSTNLFSSSCWPVRRRVATLPEDIHQSSVSIPTRYCATNSYTRTIRGTSRDACRSETVSPAMKSNRVNIQVERPPYAAGVSPTIADPSPSTTPDSQPNFSVTP